MDGWVERGVWVYEAYEVKKGGKIKLSLTLQEKDFLYIFIKSLLHRKTKTLHYSLLLLQKLPGGNSPHSQQWSAAAKAKQLLLFSQS